MSTAGYRVEAVDYTAAQDDLRRVRDVVFVEEQGVPRDLERDALDPLCHHVIARNAEGQPIGTARLTPALLFSSTFALLRLSTPS